MGKIDADAPASKPEEFCTYSSPNTQYWTSDPTGEAVLQESKEGYGSYTKGVGLFTLPEIFELAVKKHPKASALRTEGMGKLPTAAKGEKPEIPPALPFKDWKTWTWKMYHQDVKNAAKGFMALGLQQHDTVNIFGFNSPEWLIAMCGAIFAGGKAAGIYPSDTPDQVRYKSDHSNGAIAVVEDESCFEKFKKVANQLPYLKAIVTYACEPGEDIKTPDGRIIRTFSFTELIDLGSQQSEDILAKRMAVIKPSHCAALIYTSGTTGAPKAVMISHDNFIFTAATVARVARVIGERNAEEKIISYLPLSHVAGMMVDVIVPIVVTSNIIGYKGWMSSSFARAYDLKLGSLVDRLKAVQPTIFLGVPRVWEKMEERLKAVGATTKGIARKLANYAKKRAALYQSTRQLGGEAKTPKTMFLANKVLMKIRTRLGLDKCKFFFSGAAPMAKETLEFFGALGININEVYGMSECTGACTWSTDKWHVWGAVGFAAPSVEVRIFKKDEKASTALVDSDSSVNLFAPTEDQQGEVCFRGRSIMMGYLANPRFGKAHIEEISLKNAEAIDKFGFLHSGDKGTKDVHNMIRITGRFKELIKGAGGENIAPVPIEDEIKATLDFVSNVMMIGNKRKYNVCVITLKTVGATGELPGSDKLTGTIFKHTNAKTIAEAMKDEKLIAYIEQGITKVNNNEAVVVSNAAKIQKFTILPRDFSVVTGELTATLKLKRNVAEETFAPIVDKMYDPKIAANYVPYDLAPTPNLEMGFSKDDGKTEMENESKKFSFNAEEIIEEADKEDENVPEADIEAKDE